jgi:hypothetical protein
VVQHTQLAAGCGLPAGRLQTARTSFLGGCWWVQAASLLGMLWRGQEHLKQGLETSSTMLPMVANPAAHEMKQAAQHS